MPKNAYFLEKICEVAAASGTSPPNSHWYPAAGGSAPDPRFVFYIKGFLHALFILLSLLFALNSISALAKLPHIQRKLVKKATAY